VWTCTLRPDVAVSKRWLGRVADAMVVVLFLGSIGFGAVVLRHRDHAHRGAAPDAFRRIGEWPTVVSGGHTLGTASARLKLVEFGDFQCPVCRTLHFTLMQLQRETESNLVVIFRHLPLEALHPYAEAAASASECAAAQGRFAAFHDSLFVDQEALGVRSWDDFARAAGVRDLHRFSACIKSEGPRSLVESDAALGRGIGLRGTPTLILDGELYSGGSMSLGELKNWIQEHRREGAR
jgi:protein-disulfide isomerase